MRRLGNLITEETLTMEFCTDVILEAARGKTDRKEVINIIGSGEEVLKNYTCTLRSLALNPQSYIPRPYRHKNIMENGKQRKLCVPEFWPDQCMHHLLIMLIEDNLYKRLDPYAIACIPGRGISSAAKKVREWVQVDNCDYTVAALKQLKETRYCFKSDIYHCFPSLTPVVIMDRLKEYIKDKRWLMLMGKILSMSKSLPIGTYFSGWILNFCLKDFDQAIRDSGLESHYMRYMDDFIVLTNTKENMKEIKRIATDQLSLLGLRLKNEATEYIDLDNNGYIDFMGYVVGRNKFVERFKDYDKLRRKIRELRKLARTYGINFKDKNDFMYYSLYLIDPNEAMSIMSMIGMASHCLTPKSRRLISKDIKLALADNIRHYNPRAHRNDFTFPDGTKFDYFENGCTVANKLDDIIEYRKHHSNGKQVMLFINTATGLPVTDENHPSYPTNPDNYKYLQEQIKNGNAERTYDVTTDLLKNILEEENKREQYIEERKDFLAEVGEDKYGNIVVTKESTYDRKQNAREAKMMQKFKGTLGDPNFKQVMELDPIPYDEMKKRFKKENMKEPKIYSHKMQIYQEYRNKLNRENRDRMLAEQEANNPIYI